LSPDEIEAWLKGVLVKGDPDRNYILGASYQAAGRCGALPPRARQLAEEALIEGLEPARQRREIPGRFADRRHLRHYVCQRAVRCVQRRMQKEWRERSDGAAASQGLPVKDMPLEEIRPWVFKPARPAAEGGTGQDSRAEEIAAISQCWNSLEPRDRALLTDKYLNGVPDRYRDVVPDRSEHQLILDELAEKYLPPDGRSAGARSSRIYRQLLEAKAKFWRGLLAAGVDPQRWGCRPFRC
jgi:DNA-directed RNA polymerase specialized sigma24 family protein